MNTINGTSNGAGSHEPQSAATPPASASAASPAPTPAATVNGDSSDTTVATAATVGVVAVGALIFEAALLPGLILGVAAVLAPKYMPKIGSALNPMFRSTVRGAYRLGQKSREVFAEAQEHMHDIAAEVNAEADAKLKSAAATAAANGSGAGGAVAS